ncbi:50S ribosomal protein L16 [Candidatus Collierbacteria bacterium RIFOXYB1_FULL_49_13]|uniref:Large ribosomal subunit protein uL16 n=1 Tax=Candidatus Collierbacteria bacterium RIFOXYB1_FULL_49_13 TaxID=1817728 RepID=A0A1F5FHR9_9BACT|nr:ribosomal protein L16 [uncultured bacterium]OGD79132.1 MAG: 50S ribosomal protein L16 [Candidatus Collierbacteria bacterium RIFOXYB1_FULL_49_13]
MLQPRRRKHRKEFRGTMTGPATRGNTVAFGEFGLKALGCGWLTGRQLESARRTITHYTKRTGKVFIRVFPHKPYTLRAAGSRMGSGKGDIEGYVAVIKPGHVLFELAGVTLETAQEAFRLAGHKLPVRTKLVERI